MKTVFFDVDTQLDFLYPAGALYVPGAEHIVSRVAALNRYAAEHEIPVVSTMDAHTEDDPEFRDWPPHCVAGTAGQQKPAATLLEPRTTIRSAREDFDCKGARQILLQKQSIDCFTNANLPALLDQLKVKSCVVYGVVTEICVRNAALGLLKAGLNVMLVTDAVRSLDDTKCAQFFQEFAAAGGELTTVQQVTGFSLPV
ncbi:MAG: cysteine hydrolase [Acidobacteriia bacterium]|nr:cysteine hydrolase [Terriglobia bacterium]